MQEAGRMGSVAARLAATSRVLSVEDNADIADFLRAYFRASGYDVVHIDPSSAEEVLAAVERLRPDCILLDMGLRGFSGVDAYRLIRSDARFAFIPVIVVTADATAANRTRPIAGGVDAFVTKPFNVNSLAGVVAERIGAARQMAQTGIDEVSGLMTQEYLTARLSDELGVAVSTRSHLSFALVQLRSLPAILVEVGQSGTTYVARELLRRARELLPATAALGRTKNDELAILLPGIGPAEAQQLITKVLAAGCGTVELPGGAEVELIVAFGLAAYPDHAATEDELYMAADSALSEAVDRGRPLVTAF